MFTQRPQSAVYLLLVPLIVLVRGPLAANSSPLVADLSHRAPRGPNTLTRVNIPVLLYQQMNTTSSFSISEANFGTQMSYLRSQRYSSISPEVYARAAAGEPVSLPQKPILITFDDNIANMQPATAILAANGLRAAMYVVTGFADETTGWNLNWDQLRSLVSAGWFMQLGAGPRGHSQLPSGCVFYGCRDGESEELPAYERRVVADLDDGESRMRTERLLTDVSMTFALPFDDFGSDTEARAFFTNYTARRFRVVFVQANGLIQPGVTRARRFRKEILSSLSLADFAASLTDTRFQIDVRLVEAGESGTRDGALDPSLYPFIIVPGAHRHEMRFLCEICGRNLRVSVSRACVLLLRHRHVTLTRLSLVQASCL
jgi:hypothetical protein